MTAAAKRYECLVTVETEFLPDQSDLERNRYAFAYHIKIVNTGNVAAQLISRHWVIDEFNGEQQEVRGLGVVGAQPLLQPNGRRQWHAIRCRGASLHIEHAQSVALIFISVQYR